MTAQQQMKKVSVIVVVYNGMAHVEECISSMLQQTYPNFEIIFVDNCSTDGSLDYARERFPDLIFVACDQNLGYGGGINLGLKSASGDYVVPLNQDTAADSELLVHMVEFLEEHPRAGAVCPRSIVYQDRTLISALGADIHVTGFSYSRAKFQKDDATLHIPIRVNGVSGSAYMIRRDILTRMGGLEECFGGMDDTVLSWTLQLMDYELYCVPESVLYHKHQIELTPDKVSYLERDRLELLFTSLKPYTLILLAPFLVGIELLMLVYFLLRGRGYLNAKLGVWRQLVKDRERLRERRRQTERLRKISDFELFRRLTIVPDLRQMMRAVK